MRCCQTSDKGEDKLSLQIVQVEEGGLIHGNIDLRPGDYVDDIIIEQESCHGRREALVQALQRLGEQPPLLAGAAFRVRRVEGRRGSLGSGSLGRFLRKISREG